MKTPPVYRLGVLADLHVFSRYGLIPPRYLPAVPLPSATMHSYLWEIWQDFCKKCPPLDALIVNGDIYEGESPSKKDAMDALSDDLNLQVDASIETLGMIRNKVKKLWILRGTPYHDGKHAENCERIAQALGAEEWAPRRYSGYVLEGDFHGLKVNATHHMTIGAIYRGTISDRTAQMAVACEQLAKTNHADLIIRSHIHSTHKSEVFGKWVLLTRCWKVINPYAIKRMEYYRAALLNDLGGHVLETDGHGSIHWRTGFEYDPPKFDVRQLA